VSSVDDANQVGYENSSQAVEDAAAEDEAIETRLQNLVAQQARERAEMAERISQLQEENDGLKKHLHKLESMLESKKRIHHQAATEQELGLDFSLPEGRNNA